MARVRSAPKLPASQVLANTQFYNADVIKNEQPKPGPEPEIKAENITGLSPFFADKGLVHLYNTSNKSVSIKCYTFCKSNN